MLLLAGFLIASTAIVAIGAYSALQRTETQVVEEQHSPMMDLFLNTRTRAIEFFGIVTGNSTFLSVDNEIDGYLASQYQTARSLSLDLNATLAARDTASPIEERSTVTGELDFVDDDDPTKTWQYQTPESEKLWSHDGKELYTCSALTFDPTEPEASDGLITKDDGTVVGAIFWLEVSGPGGSLDEFIVIDIPSTRSPCT